MQGEGAAVRIQTALRLRAGPPDYLCKSLLTCIFLRMREKAPIPNIIKYERIG